MHSATRRLKTQLTRGQAGPNPQAADPPTAPCRQHSLPLHRYYPTPGDKYSNTRMTRANLPLECMADYLELFRVAKNDWESSLGRGLCFLGRACRATLGRERLQTGRVWARGRGLHIHIDSSLALVYYARPCVAWVGGDGRLPNMAIDRRRHSHGAL